MPIASLPAGTSSPGAARAFMAAWLESWGLESLNERAAVAISELATNAVLHAQQPFEIRVDPRAGGVWIGVTDHLREPLPALAEPSCSSSSGRGLPIVAGLADAWGTEPLEDNGKLVWCFIGPDGPSDYRSSG